MPTINQMRQALMQRATRRMSDGGQPDEADENPDSRRVAESKAMLNPKVQTVRNPQRMAFPGIYKNPKEIAAEAAARVEPEDPALKRLFGVSRGDLYEMGKGRKGNLPGTLPGAAAKPKGSAAATNVMVPKNRQRLLDVLGEAEKYPALVQGMDPWYITDPAFQRMVHLIGYENAVREYDKLNHLMGMASPASDVMTEIPRGTAAYSLHTQGRFPEFVKYAGMPEAKRTRRFPKDIRNVPGHAYHKTAQAGPMAKYLDLDEMTMKTPKVPLYIQASSVPEVGFQTETPVGDAHWSRGVGLADTRNWKTVKGKQAIPGASVTNPEMSALKPWWKEIAEQLGLESVPAQARAWGTFAPQTGVDTPIGAGKLELLARNIMYTAHRLGVSPETARDMILTGKTYAGRAEGGSVNGPSMDDMRAALVMRKADGGSIDIKEIGAEEAPNMAVKEFLSPGTDKISLPIGGVDFQPQMPGKQMLPQPAQPPGMPGQPQGAMPPGAPPMGAMPPGMPGAPPAPPALPRGPQSNILAMTPQGQAMQAMRPNPVAMPRPPMLPMKSMAKGGSTTPSVQEMKQALGKFLEGSKVKERLYHGTDKDFSSFNKNTFLALDPKFAEHFPGGNEPEGQRILPVHVNVKNPWDYKNRSHIHKLTNELRDEGLDPDIELGIHEGDWNSIEHPDVINAIKRLGHDSVFVKEIGNRNLLVFKPEQIKSAIGNRGTYDKSNPDITMKRGGSTHDIHMTERKL